MNLTLVKGKHRLFYIVLFSVLSVGLCFHDQGPRYEVHDAKRVSLVGLEIEPLRHIRARRDAADTTASVAPPTATATSTAPGNATVNASSTEGATTYNGTLKIPLLGANGTGILRNNVTNQPRVSDPILDDEDNFTDGFRKTQEMIQAQHNLTQLKYDNHTFYNSTFIGNETYFNEFWNNVTSGNTIIHPMLSNSYRHAAPVTLSFPFPFYGHMLKSVTVATGGFVYMGDHIHDWLAATQYVAPLMANFLTNATIESSVKIKDDGEKFTVIWEKVPLQERQNVTFTFAVTLFRNGDIVFAYKDIPIPVQAIDEVNHPVKVGISDAYQTDRIVVFMTRKTIYEYHRASFTDHAIANHTLLRLVAVPTCLQFDSCESCLNHNTTFNCMWCAKIQKCSGGIDRNKQDWMFRNCDNTHVVTAAGCGSRGRASPAATTPPAETTTNKPASEPPARKSKLGPWSEPAPARPLGGVAAAAAALALLTAVAVWAVWAFKHPHTRSGQFLIKYRPSQWSWKRGEARYTAATIHM